MIKVCWYYDSTAILITCWYHASAISIPKEYLYQHHANPMLYSHIGVCRLPQQRIGRYSHTNRAHFANQGRFFQSFFLQCYFQWKGTPWEEMGRDDSFDFLCGPGYILVFNSIIFPQKFLLNLWLNTYSPTNLWKFT